MGYRHAKLGRYTGKQVTASHTEMIDVVFEVSGETLPTSYPYALWEELTRLVPELNSHEAVGVLPLRTAESNEGMLIPKRAKLVLRLPHELAETASRLAHQQMRVAGSLLQLGSGRQRTIQPFATLHAQLVTGADDEIVFVADIESALGSMGVKANLICGQRRTLAAGERAITGYSLVLHDLTAEGSLRVQYAGLGIERRFGCGIFLPHKIISSFE